VADALLIGIAGGTGSGKTSVATRIVEQLPEGRAVMLQQDWYYRNLGHLPFEERVRTNFDEPAALESELLRDHLFALKNRRAVDCPQYDFTTHTRSPIVRHIQAHAIVVVEGILLFAVPELRDLFALRLYVDTDDDIRLMRRIKRDIIDRGRDIESIQRQYYQTVRPMHLKWVAPTKRFAHLVIPEGGHNREALDVIVGRLLYTLLTADAVTPPK
jgi:uridine kinase